MSLPSTGEIVRIRSRQFLVEDVRPEAGAQTLVSLSCVDDDAQGDRLRVLWEREPDAKVLRSTAWDVVSRKGFDEPRRMAAYLHAQRWNCVTATDPELLQAPHRAGIRIEPYQLEPLRRALQMPRVNLFIADDVGLGKTIEAGLILRELMLRQRVRRVVVAAPPSVVTQWREELESRFGLGFVIFDRDYVTRRRRERGWTLNPWSTHSRFVISHALLRDEAHAAPLRDWLDQDPRGALLILDEAHNAAPASGSRYAIDSRLTRAVRDLAPRFEHRLFLSATPHNGHSNSFAALLEVLDPQRFCRGVPVRGRQALAGVLVRRLKSDLRHIGSGSFPKRSVVQVDIDGLGDDAPELRLPALLDEYRTVRVLAAAQLGEGARTDALLVVTGLQKRLLSSVEAFARTLAVHRATLRRQRAEAHTRRAKPDPQGALSLDAPGADDEPRGASEQESAQREVDDFAEATASLPVTPHALQAREDSLLDAMHALAESHRHGPDARVRALVTWMRENLLADPARWGDRRVVIFTEYADTRTWLMRCLGEAFAHTDRAEERFGSLHGQMGDDARDAVKRAFNLDPARHPLRVLIATDAAREGVNLQNHCADLFHFDVPWNPSRMEQRNGRIDRTLQRAKEVRCHYFFHRQRPEDQVLQALVQKTRKILKELGSLSEVVDRNLGEQLREGIRRDEVTARAQRIEALPIPGLLPAPIAPPVSDEDPGLDERDAGDDTVVDELETARASTARLQEEVNELAAMLDKARNALKVDPQRLRHVLDAALSMIHAPPLAALDGRTEEREGEAPPRFTFPALDAHDPAWADALDALRPPRPKDIPLRQWRRENPLRPIVFRDPGNLDGAVVHLHLEHAVVRRLLGRLLAQGFVHEDLSRACILPSEDDTRRVVLVGRLSLYGDGAARLHDQLVFVTAPWPGPAETRKSPLKPYERGTHQETLTKLDAALVDARNVEAPETLRALVTASVARDVEELRGALQSRAVIEGTTARTLLERRATAEAARMTELLLAQRRRIHKQVERFDPTAADDRQRAFGFYNSLPADEKRQLDADKLHWRRRLTAIERELTAEPARIQRSYEVCAERVEPVAVLYLARFA